MKRLIVRYKVKADRADENQKYIQKVFEELHRSANASAKFVSSARPSSKFALLHLGFPIICRVPSGSFPLRSHSVMLGSIRFGGRTSHQT